MRLFIESWRGEGGPIYILIGQNLTVTATEVSVEFHRPPRETFGELLAGGSVHMRFRLEPDMAIGIGSRVKQPGERKVGYDVELLLISQAVAYRPHHQQLLGDAMHGNGDCSDAKTSWTSNGTSCTQFSAGTDRGVTRVS